MLSFRRLFLFIGLMFAIGCEAPSPVEVPPNVPDGSVFRPVFSTAHGQVSAGTACLVSLSSKKQYIVLSAIHLLGPAGGLNQDVATRNIDKIVTELTLKPCFGNAKPLTIQAESLPIHDASPELQPAGPGDIIAFWAPRSDSIEALSLASDTPRPGTRVWLAASVMEGASPSQRVHGATVTNRDTFGLLFYEFDIADLSLEATSGAPVLDANGHVVAIHLARVSDGGRFLGAGNPVGRFGPYLVSAAERSAVD